MIDPQHDPEDDWVSDFELFVTCQPITEILGQERTDEFLSELYWTFDPASMQKKLRDLAHDEWVKARNGHEDPY